MNEYPDYDLPWQPYQHPACQLCDQPATRTTQGFHLCNACYFRVQSYASKVQNRLDRMESRADQLMQQAQSELNRAHQMAQAIPFGQPILVGHHSEKRDRRYRQRIEDTFRRGFEHYQQAKNRQERAVSAVKHSAISSDDPAAILKLQAKIEQAEQVQTVMKTANAAIRKAMKRTYDDPAQRIADLAQELNLSEKRIAGLLKPDFCGRIGFPDFELTNNNANIHRMKKRLDDLKKQNERAQVEPAIQESESEIAGLQIIRNLDENRIQLVFDDKPEANIRTILKTAGFRWAPSQGAWQRQLNNSAEWAVERVINQIKRLTDEH
jgi:hypothetical protein